MYGMHGMSAGCQTMNTLATLSIALETNGKLNVSMSGSRKICFSNAMIAMMFKQEDTLSEMNERFIILIMTGSHTHNHWVRMWESTRVEEV